LNNNRGSNRRRGRGSNRQQGHQQLNRIDSRARGNAPQLLDKYKKLAHDAHLNGDRVQEEYYLQFADHYFRVIADQKQRQEEAREKRRDERGQDENDRDRGDGRSDDDTKDSDDRDTDRDDGDGRSPYEPDENPFVRENRGERGTRGRKPRRSSNDEDRDSDGDRRAKNEDGESLDPSALPPAISAANADEASDDAEAEPKPRRRTRKPKPPADDSGEALEAVN